jgi:hypothetical protein
VEAARRTDLSAHPVERLRGRPETFERMLIGLAMVPGNTHDPDEAVVLRVGGDAPAAPRGRATVGTMQRSPADGGSP